MRELSQNSIAIAGEFAVLSQLALRGFDANMTLGNTKNVDILVADPRTGDMFQIQVKTHYANTSSHGETLDWVMSEKHECLRASNLLYIFVRIEKAANSFRFFIVPSRVVATYLKESHDAFLAIPTHRDNPVRRFRLGVEEQAGDPPSPLAKDYEDRWGFLGSPPLNAK